MSKQKKHERHKELDRRRKRRKERLKERVRQAIAANEHDGTEVMGLGAVFAALGGGEFNLRHGPYYRGRTKEA